jgi:hypothetical protein
MSESVGPGFRMNTGDNRMNTGDNKQYNRLKTFNQKIPFYDLKAHGLIDESEIKDKVGLFEEDSFIESVKPNKQTNLLE